MLMGIFFSLKCSSLEIGGENFNEIYKEQFIESGASELKKSLPEETAKSLGNLGITGQNWEEFVKLDPKNIFGEVINTIKSKSSSVFVCASEILAVILICAMLQNMKTQNEASGILGAIGVMCLCVCVVNPVVKCIYSAALVIKSAAGFILCFVPVMAGIMVVSGNPITATSYQVLTLGVGELLSQAAGNFIVPVMNTVLGFSVISAVSLNISLENICKIFNKTAKTVFSLGAAIFVAVLTLQNLVTSSADNVSGSALKFALGGVPIVGGVLGDAVGVVHGCVKLLKSGVGAFGVIAGGMIFLPVILECLSWILLLNALGAVSDALSPGKISSFLKNISEVMSTILAALVCSAVVLVISSVIVLMMTSGR